MPKIYGNEYREAVINNIESGKRWEEVSKIFKVSTNTISRWLRDDKEGVNVRKSYKNSKVDSRALKALVEESPDLTLKELAQEFGVCFQLIDYHLKKLGITRKKNHDIQRTKSGRGTKIQAMD